MFNLLCSIAALALTSALSITPGWICASIVFAVESIPKAISPTTDALIASLLLPVNTSISFASRLLSVNSCKLPNVKFLKLTTSCGCVGSPTLISLNPPWSIGPFIASEPSSAIKPPLIGGIKFADVTGAPPCVVPRRLSM